MKNKIGAAVVVVALALNVGFFTGQATQRSDAQANGASGAEASEARYLKRISRHLRAIRKRIGDASFTGPVNVQLDQQRLLLYQICKNTGEPRQRCSPSAGN